MTLNLKSEEGKAIFHRLAEWADVIVENFRPDVKHRLGIDYESVRQVNPSIIYGSISGFGQEGPYVRRPGVDPIAQAMSGLMSLTGTTEGGPTRVGISIADLTTGFLLAQGLIMALLHRERTGEGQWVHTSLLETQLQLLDYQGARWVSDGMRPPLAGNHSPRSAPNGLFEAADGQIIISAANRLFHRLCPALGASDLAEHPDYNTAPRRFENRVALNAEINRYTRKKTRAEWIEILNTAGVPCGPIYHVDEAFQDPQVQYLGVTRPVDHPQLGELQLLGQALHLEATPQPSRLRRATPDTGQHTDEILAQIGYTPEQVQAFHEGAIV